MKLTDELMNYCKEIDLDDDLKAAFFDSIKQQQWEYSKKLLNKQRAILLAEMHTKQDKLYCIDFFLRKLKHLEG